MFKILVFPKKLKEIFIFRLFVCDKKYMKRYFEFLFSLLWALNARSSFFGVFSIIAPHEILTTHYGIFTMMGGIGYLTTRLGVCNGKDPFSIKHSDNKTGNNGKSVSVRVRKFLNAMLKLEPNYAQHIIEI